LNQSPVDITPLNKGVFPWTGKDLDQFESDWSYKPVSVTGVYDHSKEYKLETMFRGEKGV